MHAKLPLRSFSCFAIHQGGDGTRKLCRWRLLLFACALSLPPLFTPHSSVQVYANHARSQVPCRILNLSLLLCHATLSDAHWFIHFHLLLLRLRWFWIFLWILSERLKTFKSHSTMGKHKGRKGRRGFFLFSEIYLLENYLSHLSSSPESALGTQEEGWGCSRSFQCQQNIHFTPSPLGRFLFAFFFIVEAST